MGWKVPRLHGMITEFPRTNVKLMEFHGRTRIRTENVQKLTEGPQPLGKLMESPADALKLTDGAMIARKVDGRSLVCTEC